MPMCISRDQSSETLTFIDQHINATHEIAGVAQNVHRGFYNKPNGHAQKHTMSVDSQIPLVTRTQTILTRNTRTEHISKK